MRSWMLIANKERRYQQLETVHRSKEGAEMKPTKGTVKMYALYAPIRVACKESQALKGLAKMKYDI